MRLAISTTETLTDLKTDLVVANNNNNSTRHEQSIRHSQHTHINYTKQTSYTPLSNTLQTTSKAAKHTPRSETIHQHNANSNIVFHKAACYHPHSSTYTHLTLRTPRAPVKLTTYTDDISTQQHKHSKGKQHIIRT